MSITIHICPDPRSAEQQLNRWIARHRPDPASPALERLNILVGSGLQRRYHQRRLARNSAGNSARDQSGSSTRTQSANQAQPATAAHAAIYFFTPTDLAREITARSDAAADPPPADMPGGADLPLIEDLIADLDGNGTLRALHANLPGLAEAMRVSLNDLREGGVDPGDLRAFAEDRALNHADRDRLLDIAALYVAWTELLRDRNLADRTATYEAALDAGPEAIDRALGGAPLAVIALYDFTRIQRLLLDRCAAAVDISVFAAVPDDDPFASQALDALREDAGAEIQRQESTADAPPEPTAFSAPDPLAEAAELARLVIDLAEQGVPFNEIAIFHREGANADQRIACALERAGADTFIAAGVPYRHSAVGRAAIQLVELLCDDRPNRARLLEFLGNPVVRPPLPAGMERKSGNWERISRSAGLTSGWKEFDARLSEHIDQLDEEREWERQSAAAFRAACGHLGRCADQLDSAGNWTRAAEVLASAFEDCVRAGGKDEARIRKNIADIFAGLGEIDGTRASFTAARARSAALGILQHERLRDPDPFSGVLIGTPAGAARAIRFDAVFIAGLAERTFPAVPREDPLLDDAARRGLNQRLGARALRLNRAKSDHQKLQFKLARSAARGRLNLSYARRASVGGAPSHPSPLLLAALTPENDPLLTSEELEQSAAPAGDGPAARFRRLPASISGATPLRADAAEGEWSAVLRAVDESDFRLALLGARGVEPRPLLRYLWPEGAEPAIAARAARNEGRFTAHDGIVDLRGLWSPFADERLSPTALERYASCPYQFFLGKVLGIRAVEEPDAGAQLSARDLGTIMHAALEDWVKTWLETATPPWREYAADPAPLAEAAGKRIDIAEEKGQLGGPDIAKALRSQILGDLEQTRRREQVRAADGWTPARAEWEFEQVELETEDGRTIRVNGKVDRVDEREDGRWKAIDYKTGKFRADAAAQFASGRALQLPVYMHAIDQRLDGDLADSRAELAYITEHGGFERDSIEGAGFAAPATPDAGTDAGSLAHALGVIADGMEAGRFFPYPFREQPKPRPNSHDLVCTYCDYQAICTADIHRRYIKKAKTDRETVAPFQQMHDLRPAK